MSSQIVHSGIAELTEEQLVEQVAGEFLKDEWKRLTKGLPAWKVATILNGHMLGLDWRGSSKRDMGKAWVDGIRSGCRLRDRSGLRKELLAEPKVTAKERAESKRKREADRRFASFLTLGMDEVQRYLPNMGNETLNDICEELRRKREEIERKLASGQREWDMIRQMELAAAREMDKRESSPKRRRDS